jgi:hypothetical protein
MLLNQSSESWPIPKSRGASQQIEFTAPQDLANQKLKALHKQFANNRFSRNSTSRAQDYLNFMEEYKYIHPVHYKKLQTGKSFRESINAARAQLNKTSSQND